MKVNLFDYELPQNLIAQYPVTPRDKSRLLVYDGSKAGFDHRTSEQIRHRKFVEITEFLNSGDLLVFNNTRVIPARLFMHKSTGGKVELLLTHGEGNIWHSIFKASHRPKAGTGLFFDDKNLADKGVVKVLDSGSGREIIVELPVESSRVFSWLEKVGHVPLPPYIERNDEVLDKQTYQTIYAEKPGAVAAPTAGLHFTQRVLKNLREKGVKFGFLTLHVGIGTFAPVKCEDTREHKMHSETYSISSELAEQIKSLPSQNKVVAVGTTSLRALEGAAAGSRQVIPGTSSTNIFIVPGYEFKVIDALLTNFHLPRSTLLMLVSAFKTRKEIMEIYKEAVINKYRFFSYGDAMLLL
ncbi:MAG: tRNA preQ1(34) S-adenosylmethionine ribosyltransferase-isomerase QueA [Myxococcota bacterium]